MNTTKLPNAIVECVSPSILFFIAYLLTISTNRLFVDINMTSLIFILFFVSISQYLASKLDMFILKICLTWVTCIILTWFVLISLNTILTTLALILCLLNVWAFIILVNHIEFDWHDFIKD